MSANETPEAILITGAVRRLGFLFAQKSLAMGFSVVAHYRSSRSALEQWLGENPRYASRIHFIPSDLAIEPQRCLTQAAALPIRLIGLVNNASTFTKGNLNDITHFNQACNVNAFAPLALCAAFQEHAKTGWIINITDAHIRTINKNYQNYRISKLFLQELTRQLAFLYAPSIRVNALAPGAMLPSDEENEAGFAALAKKIPLQRTGDTDSLLKAYAFLIENDYITGQTIFVDGGWRLAQ